MWRSFKELFYDLDELCDSPGLATHTHFITIMFAFNEPVWTQPSSITNHYEQFSKAQFTRYNWLYIKLYEIYLHPMWLLT